MSIDFVKKLSCGGGGIFERITSHNLLHLLTMLLCTRSRDLAYRMSPQSIVLIGISLYSYLLGK